MLVSLALDFHQLIIEGICNVFLYCAFFPLDQKHEVVKDGFVCLFGFASFHVFI